MAVENLSVPGPSDDSTSQSEQFVRRPSKQAVLQSGDGCYSGDALTSALGEKHSSLAENLRRRSASKQSALTLPGLTDHDVAPKRGSAHFPLRGSACGSFCSAQSTAEEPQALNHSGYVIDLLSRNKTQGSHPQESLSEHVGVRDLSLHLSKEASKHVNREMLMSDVMQEVTFFYKELGHADWKFDPTHKRTMERMVDIVKLKKTALTLSAEVSNWLFRHTLLRAHPEIAETQHERHERHQEFWAQLHEIPRKPPELPQSLICGVHAVEGLDDCRQKSNSASPTKHAKALDVKHRGDKDPWKARAAKSRCAAGTWNWARGSTDIPNQRGHTAGSKVPQTSGLWSFDEAPGFASEAGFKGSAETNVAPDPFFETIPHFRWWKARQPEPMTSSSFVSYNDYPKDKSMGAKSSSLPRLEDRPRPTQNPLAIGSTVGTRVTTATPQGRGIGSPEKSRVGSRLGCSESLPILGSQTPLSCAGTMSRGSTRGPLAMGSTRGTLTMGQSGRLWRSRAAMREELSNGALPAMLSQASKSTASATSVQEAHRSDQHEATNSESQPSMSLAPPSSPAAYPVPWQGRSPIPMLKCQDSPTKKYLHAVKARGNVPKPMAFITGHSSSFAPGPGSMSDADLDAVVEMMGMEVKLEEVTLDGHIELSEKSLTAFVKAIASSSASTGLKHLSLRRCLNAGLLTCKVIVNMLSDVPSCPSLRYLDLSGIAIGSRNLAPICKAVGEHPALQQLFMADTGLGGGTQPEQCVCDILNNPSIHKLDIGWNCFTEEVFSAMGVRLTEMRTLKSLHMANVASAAAVGYASPVLHFIEQLSRNYSLKYIDLSLNRIDFRGALTIECALANRKDVTELDVSHNALGFMGMRSLLRLLSLSSSGLTHFTCNDCSTGTATDANEVYQVFSATNPSGRYTLELHRPYHRSLLRMLYNVAERFQLPPDQAFSDIKSNFPFTHCSKDSHGVWVLPAKGNLAVTFSIDKAVTEAMKDIDDFDFARVLERHQNITRVTPAFKKVVPLLAQWKSIDGCSNEQKVFLNALSQDFIISYPHIKNMAQSRPALLEIIEKLLPCLPDGQMHQYLSMTLVPTLGEMLQLLNRQKNFMFFNIENPNGHYRLDLERPADHAVAERLVLLDRWETGVAKRLKRADTSQNANYSQFRNLSYRHQPMKQVIVEWRMPEFDVLEFDYSSGRRPPPGAKRLDNQAFSNILVGLHCSECSANEQLQSLQMVSHLVYITSMQMRALLGLYKDHSARMDLCVLWFAQVMDFQNEKVFRVRFENQQELDTLRDRLGWATLFPFIQPEQTMFKLNFKVYDQRLVCAMLMNLSTRESPGNLRNVKYVHENGYVDPLPAGLPRSWEDVTKMPSGGTLQVSYVCAPEDRNFQSRKQLFQQYGYRKLDVAEEEVMWWAALNEAPADVLTYLQWMMAKFRYPQECFQAIDGVGGNGVISFREFDESFKELNCQIFKGEGEKRRINDVFRYLDPSGEGQVSVGEFAIMGLLATEIKTSIAEFTQFCTRTFGDNLVNTWNFMDADGGGEIDLQEWCAACNELGYFGPTEPIFRHLDADSEGSVSYDEFQHLEAFKVREVKRVQRQKTIVIRASPMPEDIEKMRQVWQSSPRPTSRQSDSEPSSSRPNTASEATSRPVSMNDKNRKSTLESGASEVAKV